MSKLFETKEEGLALLDETKQMFFNVVDEDGNNVEYISRAIVRDLIEAGNVFDMDNIPVEISGSSKDAPVSIFAGSSFSSEFSQYFVPVVDVSKFDVSRGLSRSERRNYDRR